MLLEDIGKQIRWARNTEYRKAFEPYVGSDRLPTLSDESISTVFFVAEQRENENEKIAEKLPIEAREKFIAIQKMKTTTRLFFERFALFSKGTHDGMLVGFGFDDVYYVLAVWNFDGADFWIPSQDSHGNPVIS